MNIWDLIFSIIGGVIKQVDKKQENIHKYEEKFSDLDHNELVHKYRNSNGDARLAAGLLLKEEMQKNTDNK